jgi:hypothetical protein
MIQKNCFEPCCRLERGEKGDIGDKDVIDAWVIGENFALQPVAQYIDIAIGSRIIGNDLIDGAQAYRHGVTDADIQCNQVAGTLLFSNCILKLRIHVL